MSENEYPDYRSKLSQPDYVYLRKEVRAFVTRIQSTNPTDELPSVEDWRKGLLKKGVETTQRELRWVEWWLLEMEKDFPAPPSQEDIDALNQGAFVYDKYTRRVLDSYRHLREKK